MSKLLMTFVLMFGLYACGSDSDKSNQGAQIPPNMADELAFRNFIKFYNEQNPGKLVLPEGTTLDTIYYSDLIVLYKTQILGLPADAEIDLPPQDL